MNSNKKLSAKEVLKDKEARTRLRNERVFKSVVTRRQNMSKAGNRPKPNMLKFAATKASGVSTNNTKATVSMKTNTAAKNNNNMLRKSMNVYKHHLAIPFARSGLHDPKSPNYHDELVQNMKNMANGRTNILPMHNKKWFVDQLKRNVWALRNNQPVSKVNAIPVVAAPRCGVSKVKKLLLNRKGVKAPKKPAAISGKKLLNQLKSIKPVK